MTGYRRRRRARVVLLRGLRLVRRQYFSLISACVLGVALTLALTSNALESEGTSTAQQVNAAFTPWPTATPGIMPTAIPTAAPLSRLLVYYVVDSEEQQVDIENALEADAAYRARQANAAGMGATFHYFLMVQSHEDEQEAVELINELTILAPTEGYRLRVVDMR